MQLPQLPLEFKKIFTFNWKSKNVDDQYILQQQVGSGTYGSVYKSISRQTKKIVALKKMQYIQNKQQEGFPITTLREIKLLQNLSHQNILKINQVVHKYVKGSFPIVYICLDYMDFDLDRLIKQKTMFKLEVPQIRHIIKQILQGVQYLHKNDVIHRDIKSKNILVNIEGSVKIGDFGLAKNIKNKKKLTVKVVTLWYRAPQLLLGNSYYDSKVDIWSVGCILAQLMLRKPLFEEQQTERNLINRIFELMGTPDSNDWEDEVKGLLIYQDLNIKTSIESNFIYFIKKQCAKFEYQGQLLELLQNLLSLNPHRRFSATQALDHRFFKQNENEIFDSKELINEEFQDYIKKKKGSTSNYPYEKIEKKIKKN